MKNQPVDTLFADHIDPSFSSEETLRLILNNLEDTFLVVNKNLDIVITSEHTCRKIREYFGFTVKQGMSVLTLAPPERHPHLIDLYAEVFAGAEKKSESRLDVNGHAVYMENHFKPARNEEGEIIGAIVTSRNITESKKTESVLRQVEERWRFALEGGKQGVWDWNIQTGDAFYSYKRLYGYEDHEMKNRIEEWEKLIHPDDRNKVARSIELHVSSANPYMESTYRIRTRDGQDRWILSRGMLISSDEQNRPLRMIGTHTDVTEQMRTKEKLRISEQQYKTLFDANPLPCWIYDPETFRFLEVNEAALEHYGYSREEFLERTVFDIHSEDRMEELRGNISKMRTRKNESINNWQHRKKNGERIFVDLRINTIEYRGISAKLVVAHDVTSKVAAEGELRKSNERFSYAAQAASEALWEWDVDTQEFYVSQAYTDIFGWKVDAHRQFDEWHNYIHPDDRKETTEDYYSTLDNSTLNRWSKEYRYLKSDGTYAVVIDNAVILRDDQGQALKVIGAIQDISSQKHVEAELKKSNDRFLLVSRATSDAIYDWDLQTDDLHWGEGLCKLFGFQPEDVPIGRWKNLIHEDDRPRVTNSLQEAIADPANSLWKEEYRFFKADGGFSHVLDRGFIIRDEAGNALRVIGSMQDMTERKYNEQLLSLESSIFGLSTHPTLPFHVIIKELLKGLEEIHPDAYTSVLQLQEDDSITMLASPRMPDSFEKALHGLKPGPDEGSSGAAMWRKQTVIVDDITTSPLWANHIAISTKFGLAACTSLPIVNSSGHVMGALSVYYRKPKAPSGTELSTLERIRNIIRILMEQYQGLNDIRVANERFDIMMKATHDLIWDWDLETNLIYRDEMGLKKVYGLNDNDTIKGIYQWLGRIHPEDQGRAEDVINDVVQATDQDTFDLEYRFRRDDGTYSHVYDRGMIIRNDQGKPVRMIGAAQDVTDRKRLEHELLQNELERQKAINQATVDTQEEERGEIGKELHDNVNQVLTTTKLYLELALTNNELKDELIVKSTKNIVSVINEIRQLSRSLMDPSIGDLGLVDSIHDLIENINLTRKLHVNLRADRKIEKLLNKNQKLTIFRIIQEALNNAIKHAKATTVEVHFRIFKDMVSVSIQDDGIGFQPGHIRKGAGLKNIQNRIYLINGTQTIQSAPGKGCKITIKFPITQQ
jgi:PAS domain S-box-containing protein